MPLPPTPGRERTARQLFLGKGKISRPGFTASRLTLRRRCHFYVYFSLFPNGDFGFRRFFRDGPLRGASDFLGNEFEMTFPMGPLLDAAEEGDPTSAALATISRPICPLGKYNDRSSQANVTSYLELVSDVK